MMVERGLRIVSYGRVLSSHLEFDTHGTSLYGTACVTSYRDITERSRQRISCCSVAGTSLRRRTSRDP